MDMIRHGIDLDDGLFFVFDDAHDITVEFGFVLFWDKGLSAFDGEDNVYIDLCIGIGHGFPPKIPPRWGWGFDTCLGYRDIAPTELSIRAPFFLHRYRSYGAEA